LNVEWHAFSGGHEVPLVIWRAFKRWLGALAGAGSGCGH
jgi:hypothetical protein